MSDSEAIKKLLPRVSKKWKKNRPTPLKKRKKKVSPVKKIPFGFFSPVFFWLFLSHERVFFSRTCYYFFSVFYIRSVHRPSQTFWFFRQLFCHRLFSPFWFFSLSFLIQFILCTSPELNPGAAPTPYQSCVFYSNLIAKKKSIPTPHLSFSPWFSWLYFIWSDLI